MFCCCGLSWVSPLFTFVCTLSLSWLIRQTTNIFSYFPRKQDLLFHAKISSGNGKKKKKKKKEKKREISSAENFTQVFQAYSDQSDAEENEPRMGSAMRKRTFEHAQDMQIHIIMACTCARLHPDLCCPLKHSEVSDDSGSGQRRP